MDFDLHKSEKCLSREVHPGRMLQQLNLTIGNNEYLTKYDDIINLMISTGQ